MNCKQIEPLILDYFEKTISNENSKLLLEHIQECPDCKKTLSSFNELDLYLSEEKTELLNRRQYYFENLNSLIHDRIGKQNRKAKSGFSFIPKFSYSFTVLFLLLFVTYFIHNNSDTQLQKSSVDLYTDAINSVDNSTLEEIIDENTIDNNQIISSDYFKNDFYLLKNADSQVIPNVENYTFPLYTLPEIDSENLDNVLQKLENKEFI